MRGQPHIPPSVLKGTVALDSAEGDSKSPHGFTVKST
jgi:hypothetical protein